METIGVIGVGRLGLCLALILEKAGYRVCCYDVNKGMLKQIEEKTLQSPEVGVNEMLRASSNLVICSSLPELLRQCTLYFCVVATPSLPDGSYNHSFLDAVVYEMMDTFRSDTDHPRRHLVVCCTTMPGYCDTVQSRLSFLHVDVSYNPEFIAQGDILRGMVQPDMVLIGEANQKAGDEIEDVHKRFLQKESRICRMSRHQAEITKVALNCFVTTKITFANQIGDIAHAAGLDHAPILQAIGSDSRVGSKYFGWGHGYGGPCFPRDNRALCMYANTLNQRLLIGEATDQANSIHCLRLQKVIESKRGDKKILVRDLAYRKGTVILEESQSYKLAIQLAMNGLPVVLQDVQEILDQIKNEHGSLFEYLHDYTSVDTSNYFLVDSKLESLYL